MTGSGRAGAPPEIDVDARTSRISALVARLLGDLARLGYGEPVDLSYVARAHADALIETYAGYTRAGYRVETDFGEACSATAHVGNTDAEPILLDVELEDRTVICAPDGARTRPARSRWHLHLVLAPRAERILEVELRPSAA